MNVRGVTLNFDHSTTTVIATIERALDLQKGSLGENSSSAEISQWDSLGQVDIIMALNVLFDGTIFSIPEMASANSVSKILVILRRHLLLSAPDTI